MWTLIDKAFRKSPESSNVRIARPIEKRSIQSIVSAKRPPVFIGIILLQWYLRHRSCKSLEYAELCVSKLLISATCSEESMESGIRGKRFHLESVVDASFPSGGELPVRGCMSSVNARFSRIPIG